MRPGSGHGRRLSVRVLHHQHRPARPLGPVPTTNDKQAAAYHMVETHWRNVVTASRPSQRL